MKLHRFYIKGIHDKWGPLQLDHDVWIHDDKLLNEWLRVLHLKIGSQVVLFDDVNERIYAIDNIEQPSSVHLRLVTEEARKLPSRHVYLMWALLTKAENERILREGTKLGVRNFVPVITDTTGAHEFDMSLARKAIIDEAEQYARADIPDVRELINLETLLAEYPDLPLYVCREGDGQFNEPLVEKLGILVGPKVGWNDEEQSLLTSKKLNFIDIPNISQKPEAETAMAVMKLIFND